MSLCGDVIPRREKSSLRYCKSRHYLLATGFVSSFYLFWPLPPTSNSRLQQVQFHAKPAYLVTLSNIWPSTVYGSWHSGKQGARRVMTAWTRPKQADRNMSGRRY